MTKNSKRKLLFSMLFVTLLVVSSAYAATIPNAHAAEMTSAQEKSLTISRDVVGLDVEKYATSVSELPSDSYLGVVPQENVRYTFQLNASKVDVRYTFANGKLRLIHVLEGSGSPLLTKTAINTLESAKDFLGSYQEYSGNSFYGELKPLLSNVDTGKNVTKTSGNIKLEVTVSEDLETETYKWTYVYDGVEASAKCVALGYKNGFLKYFLDNWELYKIGSTSVNISEKAAIDIAMQRASTFSWNMGTDDNVAKIMNFTVANAMVWETVFFSNLYADQPRSQDPLMLYPIRHVWVSLDKFYPGNVYGINVYVWADTGDVCYIHERVSTLDPLPELVANDSDYTVEAGNKQVSGDANQLGAVLSRIAMPVFAVITLGIVPVWFLLGRKKNVLHRRSFKVGGVLLCLLSFTMLLVPVATVSASSPNGRAEIWGSESTGGYDEGMPGSWKYWRKTSNETDQQRWVSNVINGYFNNHGYDSVNNQGSQGDGSLKGVILDDISFNDANYPRVAVVYFDHGVGTETYFSGEYHFMSEDNVGTYIGSYDNHSTGNDEHAVTDMDIYERTAEGDVCFAFINTCLSACITDTVGTYETKQGIIAGTDGTYRARGLPFAWTHRVAGPDLSLYGYSIPDEGNVVYLGFPYGSAALDQTITGSDPIYALWFRDFFEYALTSDISVNDALDDTSIEHFQDEFGSTDLATNFNATWPMWNGTDWKADPQTNSRLAVYGNGRIHLYQKGGVWDLNENQGSTAHDSTYSNNDGTIYGASWTTGRFGSALNFDGSNDYVNVPHSDSISGLSAVTLSMWVKLDSLPPSHSVNLGGIIGEYWLEYRDTGYLSLSTYINGNYDGQGFSANLADGKWHMLTLTYDGTYKKGYLDGTLMATYQISGTLSNTNNALKIGNSYSASQDYSGCPDGIIDGVRVFNYAMSVGQIADDAAATVFHLNDGNSYDPGSLSGDNAYDSSPCGNTGTLYNGATWANGVRGAALSLDGSNDYVNVPHNANFSGLPALTLTMWVKLDTVPQSNSVLLGGVPNEYWFEYRNTQYLALSTYINSNYDGQGFSVNLADGHWHLLTMTYDGTYKKGYLDGVLQATYQISGTLADTNNAFKIGASFPASQGYNGCPDGIIDEVRVYNRALSADEIADYYEAFPRYYYVTVLATNQYSENLAVPIYIDGQYVGTAGYAYTVTEGSHEIYAVSPLTDYQTQYHARQYYYYDSTYEYGTYVTISVTGDKTITAYYYSTYF